MAEKNQDNLKICSKAKLFKKLNIIGDCYDLNCDCHFQDVRDNRFLVVQKRIITLDSDGHRSWIIHLSPASMYEIHLLVQQITKLMRRFDRSNPVLNFIMHYLPGKWHLNVGLASAKFSKTSLQDNNRVKLTEEWLNIIMHNLPFPYVRSVTDGLIQDRDNHLGWAKYMLRAYEMKQFAVPGEKLQGVTSAAFPAARRKKTVDVETAVVLKEKRPWKPSEID